MSLLDARVLIVTGKGGVGKTTVSMALGLEAARQGKRTIVVETQGSGQVARAFGLGERSYEARELRPGLSTLSVTSEQAIEDYVVQQVRFRTLYRMVFRNRVMGPFMDAVPGLHDVVQLGKVFDLEREQGPTGPAWDLIVIDAPATGHGLSMLSAPASMMELTVAGPFHEGARQVEALFEDAERSAIVLVCLPEEMPVNETLDLYGRLGRMAPQVKLCVLNEVHPTPFAEVELWPTAREHLGAPELAEAVHLTDRAIAREIRTRAARDRLRQGLPMPHVELPFMLHRDLTVGELSRLGTKLGQA